MDGLNGNGGIVSKPQRDPGTIKRLQSAATNVVQTAACRPQNHLCLGTFQEASLNIIGNARLVSLVGPVVFIRCWLERRAKVRESNSLRPSPYRKPKTAEGRGLVLGRAGAPSDGGKHSCLLLTPMRLPAAPHMCSNFEKRSLANFISGQCAVRRVCRRRSPQPPFPTC